MAAPTEAGGWAVGLLLLFNHHHRHPDHSHIDPLLLLSTTAYRPVSSPGPWSALSLPQIKTPLITARLPLHLAKAPYHPTEGFSKALDQTLGPGLLHCHGRKQRRDCITVLLGLTPSSDASLGFVHPSQPEQQKLQDKTAHGGRACGDKPTLLGSSPPPMQGLEKPSWILKGTRSLRDHPSWVPSAGLQPISAGASHFPSF